ncbi:MAG: sigma-E factor negative regulatory protein [Porticoccaceae bacterium]|jgi:sigma-E factor negative regulatory protein RseA|nr:sigma-E factor negative regulatory protein [Porticoccaceae bacterium]
MSDHEERLAESLSALMDGESTELETHRILKEVGSNSSATDSARRKWQRYHMASSVMSGDPVAKIDFSAAIAAAIEAEDRHRINPLRQFAGIAGRFAIAASVAMVAVLGAQQFNEVAPSNLDAVQFAEVAVDEAQQNNGPAIQFPSGFQPNVQARTVSAGGNIKVSQQPVTPFIQVRQTVNQQYSEQELRAYLNDIILKHTSHAALNSNQGMLPFARVTNSDEQSSDE